MKMKLYTTTTESEILVGLVEFIHKDSSSKISCILKQRSPTLYNKLSF